MTIQFAELPNIIFKPTDTINKLKKDANLEEGLKLYLVVAVVSFLISVIFDKLMMMRVQSLVGKLASGPTSMIFSNDLLIVVGEVFNVLLGLAFFLISCWLITKVTASIGQGKADFGKTVGLLSYVTAAFSLFIMLPLLIVLNLLVLSSFSSLSSIANLGSALLGIIAVVLIGVLFLIWEWLVMGRAASVANKTTWAAGIAGVFLAGLIIAAIGFILVMVIGLGLFMAMA